MSWDMTDDDLTDPLDPDAEITCWCGAKGTYDELFDDSGLENCCGGTGFVNCECGGDICVCHHHGEAECPGCLDCEDAEDGGWDDHDYDD